MDLEKHKCGLSRLTIVGLHGDYILKPPSAEYTELPENEDLTMHLAEWVKIKTARHSLIRLRSG
ncbi:MAG: HipA domain-containing protein [Taibaiella sp.]|nr:HipA domain-containing protein [Taibaiella sp.]